MSLATDTFARLTRQIRLDKLLSQQGLGTRNEAAELIKQGRLRLQGTKVLGPGQKVELHHGATFLIDRETHIYRPFVYVMLNKPEGVETTGRSHKRKVVSTLLSGQLMSRSTGPPFPIGRLRVENTGLMLMSDDKLFAKHIALNKITNTWQLTLPEELRMEQISMLLEGVPLRKFDNEVANVSHIAQSMTASNTWEITTEQNKYLETLLKVAGISPTHMRRLSIGRLHLPHDLQDGEWRYIDGDELALLDYQPTWDRRNRQRIYKWMRTRMYKRRARRREMKLEAAKEHEGSSQMRRKLVGGKSNGIPDEVFFDQESRSAFDSFDGLPLEREHDEEFNFDKRSFNPEPLDNDLHRFMNEATRMSSDRHLKDSI